ncbi:YaaA family protein [Aliarcobacter butzleri]|uniref:YaaA family protein n=1 Tax=Aliarcobacter butzleri TaxID=28197 RepID=UPI001EDC6A19|nr:YaaA family protein [Aliarcobacter butzleri]MCG3652703.1 YaaA family protein [Aliarcobacter butzleri]
MKILFSPSETKFKDGETKKINKNSFLFPELFEERIKVVNLYQTFVDNASNEELEKLFGTKKEDIINYYKGNLLEKEIMKVIERYDGVAFDYLKYSTLKDIEKNYIDKNVLIFSNLMGPILAGDMGLPDYKLKQNEKIGNFELEKFYNEKFSDSLDNYLKDDDIIDLRAGFYEKFYKINKPYTTMKFIKDGKVVSHWAKAYRGIILRLLAQNNTQSIDELMNMEIDNLSIEEIKKQKLKTEIIYNIR